MQHAILGASHSNRWMHCPGCIALTDKAPPQQHSSFAAEGTAAHELAELCLKEDFSASHYIGNTTFEGWDVTTEMAENVQVYLDLITHLREENPAFEIEIEHKFKLDWLYPNMWGSNDACLSEDFGRLVVLDYKHGKGVSVEVENNSQLLYYALGAYHEGDFSEIEIIIVQPRCPHKDGPIRSQILTPDELEAFAEKLKKAAIATKAPDAPLCSGEWCKFCPAAGICPALEKKVQGLCVTDFKESPLPTPQQLTAVQIKDVLANAKLIENWIGEVRTYALHTLQTGGEVEGFKLVQKKSNRQWRDKEEVKKVLKKFKKQIFVDPKPALLSPVQMETALGASQKDTIAQLCYKPDTGSTIASVDDPRREYKPAIETYFTVIGENDIFDNSDEPDMFTKTVEDIRNFHNDVDDLFQDGEPHEDLSFLE